jgi:hypothetical protein
MAGSAGLPACGSEKRDGILGSADAGTSHRGDTPMPQGGGGKPSAACPPLTVTDDLRGVFAVAPNDVWAVGNGGTVLHFDGCWRAEPKATDVDLTSVWAAADGTVWAGGASATTLRRSGGSWSVVKTPGTTAVRGIFATAPTVWAVAEEGAIYSWDGSAWQVSHVNSTEGTYHGVWGATPDDVWVVGDGKEPDGDLTAIHVHWDGAAWTESYSCNPDGNRYAAGGWFAILDDIWGLDADTIWDAGECDPGGGFVRDALIERLTGGAWPEVDIGDLGDYRPLATIWASGVSDVWAASSGVLFEGHVPTMLHFDGTAWSASSDPATIGIFHIRGTSANDVWAVGLGGKRLHFDGTTWTPSP